MTDATLPRYIYGREASPNEKVWTEQAMRAAIAQELERAQKAVNAEFGRRWQERSGLSPRALETALQAPGVERLRDFCGADPANRAALEAFLSVVFARGG